MLAPAFDDPALASQAVFRTVMEATARPGLPRPLASKLAAPPPLSATAAAAALTLLDYETPFWLDSKLAAGEVAPWLKFHTGAPLTENPAQAAFAFISDPAALPAFETFSLGSIEYPDRSTTLVVQVASLEHGDALSLSGPGIAGSQSFSAAPLPDDFRARLIANRALFPRGIDLILVSADAVAALPRSLRVAA
ncbi:MAG TPA: phosphonate C-P lyase system protein PhnH [Xanthobacteraceae bacterium]